MPVLRSQVCAAAATAAELRLSTAAALCVADGRISNQRRSSCGQHCWTCRHSEPADAGSPGIPCRSIGLPRAAGFHRELSLPILRNELFARDGAKDLTGGLDHLRASPCIYTDLFLDRFADQRGRAYLSGLQAACGLVRSMIITLRVLDLYVWIAALYLNLVITLLHVIGQVR